MRRLELLEAREPNSVNQVNPTQVTSPGCTYCHALTYLFEECTVYQAQQMFPNSMNAAYTRPNYSPYSKTYNPGWRNHPNFTWTQSGTEQPRQQLSHQYTAQTPINPIFIKINHIFSRRSNTISSPLTNISNKIIQIEK